MDPGRIAEQCERDAERNPVAHRALVDHRRLPAATVLRDEASRGRNPRDRLESPQVDSLLREDRSEFLGEVRPDAGHQAGPDAPVGGRSRDVRRGSAETGLSTGDGRRPVGLGEARKVEEVIEVRVPDDQQVERGVPGPGRRF